jgi:hypothetical protein
MTTTVEHIQRATWFSDDPVAPAGMTTSERRLAYLAQTRRRSLTPARRRRLERKDLRERVAAARCPRPTAGEGTANT